MECVNLCLMTWAAWLLLKRPEKEKLAFRLFLVSLFLTAFTYMIGARGSLVPGFNL